MSQYSEFLASLAKLSPAELARLMLDQPAPYQQGLFDAILSGQRLTAIQRPRWLRGKTTIGQPERKGDTITYEAKTVIICEHTSKH